MFELKPEIELGAVKTQDKRPNNCATFPPRNDC